MYPDENAIVIPPRTIKKKKGRNILEPIKEKTFWIY
jgi:hypothetical protein